MKPLTQCNPAATLLLSVRPKAQAAQRWRQADLNAVTRPTWGSMQSMRGEGHAAPQMQQHTKLLLYICPMAFVGCVLQVSVKYSGTVTHMPPELIEEGKVYPQGDVYAFG